MSASQEQSCYFLARLSRSLSFSLCLFHGENVFHGSTDTGVASVWFGCSVSCRRLVVREKFKPPTILVCVRWVSSSVEETDRTPSDRARSLAFLASPSLVWRQSGLNWFVRRLSSSLVLPGRRVSEEAEPSEASAVNTHGTREREGEPGRSASERKSEKRKGLDLRPGLCDIPINLLVAGTCFFPWLPPDRVPGPCTHTGGSCDPLPTARPRENSRHPGRD